MVFKLKYRKLMFIWILNHSNKVVDWDKKKNRIWRSACRPILFFFSLLVLKNNARNWWKVRGEHKQANKINSRFWLFLKKMFVHMLEIIDWYFTKSDEEVFNVLKN